MNCTFVNCDGERCGANAQHGSLWCFFHDPEKTLEQEAARLKGGKGRKRAVLEDCADIRIRKPADVIMLLNDTINKVRTGDLDHKIANSVAYLSNVLIKTWEGEELQSRLEKLEEQVQKERVLDKTVYN